MKTEIQKVKDLFNSGRLHTNEFTNVEYPSSDFPLIWEEMNMRLEYPFEAPKSTDKKFLARSLSITPEYIDFQCHDTSIEEHTDDVMKGVYFQLMVMSLDDCTGSKYHDKHPVFTYYAPDGKKCSTRLGYDCSIVFNPRKLHSVVYYGYKYTVAVRSVVKSIV
jgi:hypothetical protein